MKYFNIIISAIFFGVIVFVLYQDTLNGDFIFDDYTSIVENESIKNLSDISTIISKSGGRPLGYLTFAINYFFDGLNVFGYHLVNLIIHIINGVLIIILTQLTLKTPYFVDVCKFDHNKKQLLSFFCGLIFIVHPIQTQAVAYITQRFTSLSYLFYILCLLTYLKCRLNWDFISIRYKIFYAVILTIFFLSGIFTKETVYTLPLAIILYEYCFFNRKIQLKNLGYVLAVFLVSFSFLLFFHDLDKIFTTKYIYSTNEYINSYEYGLTSFRVLLTYIRLFFFPYNQMLDYNYDISRSILELRTAIAVIIVIVILFTAIKIFSKNRVSTFGIFLFFIVLLPESTIVPLKDAIYEHRVYFPIYGICLLIIYNLFQVIQKKWILISLLVTTNIIFAILTFNRNQNWISGFSIWNDSVIKSSNSARAYNQRGIEYGKLKMFTEALGDFKRASTINPVYINPVKNRAKIFSLLENYDSEISEYDKLIKIDTINTQNLYAQRGVLNLNRKDYNSAINDFSSAIKIDPYNAKYYVSRGEIFQFLGDKIGAIKNYNSAIFLDSTNPSPYFNRLDILVDLDRYDRAGNMYKFCKRRVIQIPQFIESKFLLSNSLRKNVNKNNNPNIILFSLMGMGIKSFSLLEDIYQSSSREIIKYNNAFISSFLPDDNLSDIIGYKNSNLSIQLANNGYKTNFIGQYYEKYDGSEIMDTFYVEPYDSTYIKPYYLKGEYLSNEQDFVNKRLNGIPQGWTNWCGLINKDEEDYQINDNGHIITGEENKKGNLLDYYLDNALSFINENSVNNPFFLMWRINLDHISTKNIESDFDNVHYLNHAFENDLSDKPEFLQEYNKGIETKFTDEEIRLIIKRPIQEKLARVKIVESFIKVIINKIESDKNLTNSIIFIYSEKNEPISKHYKGVAKFTPYDETIKVPFFIINNKMGNMKEIKDLVSIEDINPTILSLAKINYEIGSKYLLPGFETTYNNQNNRMAVRIQFDRKLVNTDDNLVPPSFKFFRSNSMKYITYENGEKEYYDLVVDPLEDDNKIDSVDTNFIMDLEHRSNNQHKR